MAVLLLKPEGLLGYSKGPDDIDLQLVCSSMIAVHLLCSVTLVMSTGWERRDDIRRKLIPSPRLFSLFVYLSFLNLKRHSFDGTSSPSFLKQAPEWSDSTWSLSDDLASGQWLAGSLNFGVVYLQQSSISAAKPDESWNLAPSELQAVMTFTHHPNEPQITSHSLFQ